jgi:hypothetical protein
MNNIMTSHARIFFFASKTILPIALTSNPSGHTIVARIKKTGSSPIPGAKLYPNSFIKRANTRLCSTRLAIIPNADEPVRIRNAFKNIMFLKLIDLNL